MTASDDRMVDEFRANGGVVVGAGGGVVLLHVGVPPRRVVPVAATLEGRSWLVAPAPGVTTDWVQAVRESPDVVVETAAGSLDVHAVELEEDEAREAGARLVRDAVTGPVFRLEPQG